MDFNLKKIDPKIWERARVKSIRQRVSISEVLRQLLKMWVGGRVEITFPDKMAKKTRKKGSNDER